MNELSLLHEELTNACPHIHKVRLASLMAATHAACSYQKNSLTGLGRTLNSEAKVKHNIKRIDRLLGNTHLHRERKDIYKALVHRLVGQQSMPIILVDWSQINEEAGFHILRASIPMGGRSLTLYEEVHPKSKSHNRQVHGEFLEQLKLLLPNGTRPILVTDAGYKNPWFKQVSKLGWYWVGRIRHITNFCKRDSSVWNKCRGVDEHATTTPTTLGAITLAKKNSINCYAHLFKSQLKGRKKLNQGKRRSNRTNSNLYSRNIREPWFLVTNLSTDKLSAKQAVEIYKTRMQIEESFRDCKNQRIGLSLKESKSRSAKRLQILLLIAALATLFLWLIGKAANSKGLQKDFQANTVSDKHVLSLFNLGLQVLRKGSTLVRNSDLEKLLMTLSYYPQRWNRH